MTAGLALVAGVVVIWSVLYERASARAYRDLQSAYQMDERHRRAFRTDWEAVARQAAPRPRRRSGGRWRRS